MKQKINWENQFKYEYAQIPKSGLQHLILNKEFKPLTNPFYCKEYYQDVLWSEIVKKSITQYGLKYTPSGILDEFYMAIRINNSKDVLKLKNVELLLTQIEQTLKCTDDGVEVVEAENCLLIKPSKWWIQSPLHSSIMLQALRHTNKFNENKSVYDNILEGSFNENYKLQINTGWVEKLYLMSLGIQFNVSWQSFKDSGYSHASGLNNVTFKNLIIK